MNRLAPVWDALAGSNLWLAIGASTMTSASIFYLTGTWRGSFLAAWVFCATLCLYNWHRLISPHKKSNNASPWAQTNRRIVVGLTVCAGIAALVLFVFLPLRVQLSLLFPSLLGLSYSLPVLPGQKRLRDVPRLKILVLASVWAWVAVYLPWLYLEIPIHGYSALVYAEKWLLFFAIAVAFDIRDVVFDQAQGTLTLPGKFGIYSAKILAQAALLLAIGLSCKLYTSGLYSGAVFGGTIFSLLCTAILIAFASPKRSRYYYEGCLDGVLILQPLAIWVLS
ncbi:hypothetical protein [Haliscomenobacter hydrossis]|uniref:UbiA prenyltransferase n=1 Tax=Haliscomenobacter hydrossis (strain ATCC 27775 / DSM 1100 / LMG 10767 / O) TaxID=760192 RepID=F4L691_HALH1|nr:hypothetical protein [Haliscomenobacter hydrossis]AEE54109.1 hypothetical protein Halhy_6289 [Haliscomenobacter hydrossis DSM 1100]